jgi:polar amino acid transport system substrate-binding protein
MDRRFALALAALALVGLFAAQTGLARAQSASPPQKEIVVAIKDAPPFAMKSESGAWTGIGIELWNRLAEKLNLRTTFREYQTVPEMLAAVSGGSAEAAVAAISVTPEREKAVDFTQPYYASGLGVAVPANKQIEWFTILRNVLTLRFLEAVAILITSAIVVGSLIWFIERRHTAHFSHDAKGFGTGLWWSASAMTQAAAADKAPATLWGRLLGIMWMISSIVIIASFTAGLTSQLAAQRLAAAVRTSADLASVRTGSVSSTSAIDTLVDEHIDPRPYSNVNAGLAALKKGKLDAFVYDRPILQFNVRKDFRDDVEVLDKLFARENYAIAVPLGSPLRLQIDVAMLEEMHEPWWREVLRRYLGNE